MTRGIYVIRCKPTGKVYVGSSKNIEQRWMNHQYKLRKGNHHSKYLQNSWNKYGAEAFELEIVEEVIDGLLSVIEQLWINKFDACRIGYNSNVPASRANAFYSPTYSFRVMLSDEEKEQLQQEAERLGLSMTDVVRQFIRKLPKVKDDESDTVKRE